MTTALYREVIPVVPNFQQEFGSFSVYDQKRVLIADGGGYGKTIQAIDGKIGIELSTGERIQALVICPNSAREYWQTQITVNYPNQKAMVLDKYDPESLSRVSDADFVILNYEVFGNKHTRDRVTEELSQMGFGYTIVDESHNAKNPKAFRSRHIRKLTDSAEYVALLSGTPVPDKLSDIYSLISMLEPETYPTAADVMATYKKSPLVLGSVLNRRMLRRGSDDVPDIDTRNVELSEDHARVYTEVLEFEDIRPTVKLDQLRKAALDPALVDPKLITDPELRERLKDIDSSKYQALDGIIQEAVGQGEKIVIFTTRFKKGVTRKLEERYKDYGALRIDGDVKAGYMGKKSRREEVRQQFQSSPDNMVLIANPDTVGRLLALLEPHMPSSSTCHIAGAGFIRQSNGLTDGVRKRK